MPAGRPKIPEEKRKPLTSESVVVRLHVRNRDGKKTTISLDPALLSLLGELLGGKDRAREWLRETAAITAPKKGRSLSRSVQTAAVRELTSSTSIPNPL